MIKYAMDKQGNLWCADDPNAPQCARCPMCGIEESLRHSTLNNAFYARFPGQVHKYKDCQRLDGSVNVFDILLTTTDNYWKHHQKQTNPPPDKPEAVPDPEDPITSDDSGDSELSGNTYNPDFPDNPGDSEGIEIPISPWTVTSPVTERVQGMRTLTQLATNGYLDSEDCDIGNSQRLSDLTINPCFSYVLLESDEIGYRVLQGVPLGYLDRKQSIQMRIDIDRNRDGRSLNLYKTADIHIPDEALYTKIRNSLFEQYIDDAGKTRVRRKYNRIAVGEEWVSTPKEHCKCTWSCAYRGWRCTGLLTATIKRNCWLYVFPNSASSKKHANSKRNT